MALTVASCTRRGLRPRRRARPSLCGCLEGGAAQLSEALLRQAGLEPEGAAAGAVSALMESIHVGVVFMLQLMSLLAHGPQPQAAALAASLAKAVRADLREVADVHCSLPRPFVLI
jgi:hypothetical protein